MILSLLVLGTYLPCIITCPYPSDLIGEWYSTSFGTLTFTNTSFSGFTRPDISASSLTFTCIGQDGNRYVSRSTLSIFGTSVALYLCMNLVRISNIKYSFTLESNVDASSGVRFLSSTSFSLSVAEACTVTDERGAGEFELLVLKASINDALIPCPGSFLSLYNVTMTTSTSSNCENSTMDGTAVNVLSFNYSSCATGIFNTGGTLYCLHNVVSGNGYLITFNNETSTDETSTFRFTCFTYYKFDAILFTTEHPRSCHANQTINFVNSPGITYVMTDIFYLPPDDDVNLALIFGLVFGIFGLIIVIVLVVVGIILYRKHCIPKPEAEPPPEMPKKKRKLSITEYSPNLSARSAASDRKELIRRQSTEEILSGSFRKGRDKISLDNEAAYKALPKQKWQKIWETKLRPGTPIMPISVSGTSVYSEQNSFASRESEMLSKKSISLPESLDRRPQRTTRKEKLRIEALDLETTRSPSPRYSERSHSSQKLPESMGKLGGQGALRQDGTIFMPSALRTIKENPLSRENTTTSVGQSAKTPKTTGTFARTYSSMTASQSTVSAGDVQLSSSRFSHLSASNESIFDDPRWLTKSTAISEKAFEVGKNLLPGLPKTPALDQKSFLRIPVLTSQQSREDLDYFKNRTRQSMGIKVSAESVTRERSASSQKIVEYETKKRKRKQEKSKPKISWIYRWEHLLRPISPFRSVVNKRRPTVTPSDTIDKLSCENSKTFTSPYVDADAISTDTDVNISRSSLTPSFTGICVADKPSRPQSASPSTIPDITLTTPDELTVSLADSVSLGLPDDTYSVENEFSDDVFQKRRQKRKRKQKATEVNVHLDLITGRSDGDRTMSRSSTSEGRSLGVIKLLIVNEKTEEEIENSEIVPEPIQSPDGEAIFRLKTCEDVDAISMSVRSNISVDEVTVDESIASSFYSDVFLPDDWLFMYSEQEMIEKVWARGSKRMSKKRKHEIKCWLKNEEPEKKRKKGKN